MTSLDATLSMFQMFQERMKYVSDVVTAILNLLNTMLPDAVARNANSPDSIFRYLTQFRMKSSDPCGANDYTEGSHGTPRYYEFRLTTKPPDRSVSRSKLTTKPPDRSVSRSKLLINRGNNVFNFAVGYNTHNQLVIRFGRVLGKDEQGVKHFLLCRGHKNANQLTMVFAGVMHVTRPESGASTVTLTPLSGRWVNIKKDAVEYIEKSTYENEPNSMAGALSYFHSIVRNTQGVDLGLELFLLYNVEVLLRRSGIIGGDYTFVSCLNTYVRDYVHDVLRPPASESKCMLDSMDVDYVGMNKSSTTRHTAMRQRRTV